MTTIPYLLAVKLYKSDGSTPRSGATIVITSQRTEETQTGTTNTNGEAVFDLANFTEGYESGDAIDVEKEASHSDMEYYVSANGDDSYPSFVQVDNETETRIYPCTARIKLNLSKYRGGREINFTLD